MVKYAIIGVEGQHDQAFVAKGLQLLGFAKFDGQVSEVDSFWRKFIPTYPTKKGKLYERLDMPSILKKDTLSVVIYAGRGSELVTNLDDIISNNSEYQTDLTALGIVADADNKSPDKVVEYYSKCFQKFFPNFPKRAGEVDTNTPRTGIYVLPDNASEGVLDTLLCSCGDVVYPVWMARARSYLDQFSEQERKSLKCKWKPFDPEKALVATVVSVLKPGKTNTVSLIDNNWVSEQTLQQVPALANFVDFLRKLLALS
jgi:hypothetical protein